MIRVVLLTQYGMGVPAPHAAEAPHDLQLRLLKSWLELAVQDGPLPAALCVYTEGVRLCADDSPLLEPLRALAEAGCEILVCTTCLNFYGLMDRLAVGTASCMSDIRARVDKADKVWPL
jgi:hypothetical protein